MCTVTSHGEPIYAHKYGKASRNAIVAGSEKLLNALHRAFDQRVDERGCSHFHAQIHLMNGVEP